MTEPGDDGFPPGERAPGPDATTRELLDAAGVRLDGADDHLATRDAVSLLYRAMRAHLGEPDESNASDDD